MNIMDIIYHMNINILAWISCQWILQTGEVTKATLVWVRCQRWLCLTQCQECQCQLLRVYRESMKALSQHLPLNTMGAEIISAFRLFSKTLPSWDAQDTKMIHYTATPLLVSCLSPGKQQNSALLALLFVWLLRNLSHPQVFTSVTTVAADFFRLLILVHLLWSCPYQPPLEVLYLRLLRAH